jgi:myosin-crossreactive antigen
MKTIIEAIKQMHKGEDGKTSSKRVYGGVIISTALATYVLDGFKFYTVNTHLFDTLMIAGTTLLGIEVAKYFGTKTKTNDKHTGDN